jgi:hypothetical protein
MTCREIREALDALLDGELEAGEELTVREHLDWCRACGQDYADLQEWHGSLADALVGEAPRPTIAERRRTADAVIAAIRPRTIPMSRLAALVAIGLSVGIVASAVGFSRPSHDQVARVVERIQERHTCDAQLRAVNAEIERDLGEARKVVSARGSEDPAARSVAIGSLNIARQLGADPVEELHRYRELVPAARGSSRRMHLHHADGRRRHDFRDPEDGRADPRLRPRLRVRSPQHEGTAGGPRGALPPVRHLGVGRPPRRGRHRRLRGLEGPAQPAPADGGLG